LASLDHEELLKRLVIELQMICFTNVFIKSKFQQTIFEDGQNPIFWSCRLET